MIRALLLVCVSVAFAGTVNVTVKNSSAWTITQFFLSPTAQAAWGADQLGDKVVPAGGGTFDLTGVPCGTYDVKLVDEDADECVVTGVELCKDSETWEITDANLLACQNQ